ncbi:MAG: glycosyltransferase [Acidimicrobiia bacterium]|nr:glycosyltransferase [Acidimicrobiia bacterium]
MGCSPRPTVDVVILTWNDGPLLGAAIASVTGGEGVDTRIVVVDNGSEPPATVPDGVTLIRLPENRGVAAGRNVGIRAGSADLVCLLDSDAELGPCSLRSLVEGLEESGADVAVPCFTAQAPTASAGAAPDLADKARRVLGRTAEYRPLGAPGPAGSGATTGVLEAGPRWWPVDFGIGACQLFRRSAWDAVGGIDETFFYGPEDVDFCLRIKQIGGLVVQVAGDPVHHPPRRIHRRPINRRGMAHAWAVARYYHRHRAWLRSSPAPRS